MVASYGDLCFQIDKQMGNTYTRLHTHYVFAVKYRRALLDKSWRDEVFMYMAGIVKSQGNKVMAINGVEDHVHLLIGMHPDQAPSRLMQVVKGESSEWINKRKFCEGRFAWQAGFGGFNVSKSVVPVVIKYIRNQEEHHAKERFDDEYVRMLKEEDIDFDERYILRSPLDL